MERGELQSAWKKINIRRMQSMTLWQQTAFYYLCLNTFHLQIHPQRTQSAVYQEKLDLIWGREGLKEVSEAKRNRSHPATQTPQPGNKPGSQSNTLFPAIFKSGPKYISLKKTFCAAFLHAIREKCVDSVVNLTCGHLLLADWYWLHYMHIIESSLICITINLDKMQRMSWPVR